MTPCLISRLIREQWRNQLSTLGQTIQVRQGNTILSGVAEDVNENGELLLRCILVNVSVLAGGTLNNAPTCNGEHSAGGYLSH